MIVLANCKSPYLIAWLATLVYLFNCTNLFLLKINLLLNSQVQMHFQRRGHINTVDFLAFSSPWVLDCIIDKLPWRRHCSDSLWMYFFITVSTLYKTNFDFLECLKNANLLAVWKHFRYTTNCPNGALILKYKFGWDESFFTEKGLTLDLWLQKQMLYL